MMTKSVFRTLALVACTATMALTTAGDDRASLNAAYAKLSKAVKSMNSKGVYAMLTPGFTWTEVSGHTMTRQEFIAMDTARMKSPGLKFHEVTMKNDSYDFMGKEARVRSTTRVVMSMLEGGKRVKFEAVEESVDTWHRGPKGWLCHKVETTSSTFRPL